MKSIKMILIFSFIVILLFSATIGASFVFLVNTIDKYEKNLANSKIISDRRIELLIRKYEISDSLNRELVRDISERTTAKHCSFDYKETILKDRVSKKVKYIFVNTPTYSKGVK